MAHLITDDNLGAWLIKCNPEANPDVVAQLDQSGTFVVTTWCVAHTCRSRMMKPGDRAVLWVSGNGRRMTRGVWGMGRVTGTVEDGRADTGTAGPNVIPLDIPVFKRGAELSSDELVRAGITDLEVQVSPAMSNPSWVTKDQLARMDALLEA